MLDVEDTAPAVPPLPWMRRSTKPHPESCSLGQLGILALRMILQGVGLLGFALGDSRSVYQDCSLVGLEDLSNCLKLSPDHFN